MPGMTRRYIHSTSIAGETGAADTNKLRALLDRASSSGMTAREFEDELARLTGFEDVVRAWFQLEETPNGLIRKVILSCAKQIVKAAQS